MVSQIDGVGKDNVGGDKGGGDKGGGDKGGGGPILAASLRLTVCTFSISR